MSMDPTCGNSRSIADSNSSDICPHELSGHLVPSQHNLLPRLISNLGSIHGVRKQVSNAEEVEAIKMTTGASLPPPAPMTASVDGEPVNVTKQCNGHGEDDATPMSPAFPSLRETCADVHDRVSRFLNAEPRNEKERRTQSQSKIALQVIEEALQKYEYVCLPIREPIGEET